MAGRAYTVRCVPYDNLPIHRALEQLSEGDVLVVDAGGTAAGYVGEVIARAATVRGCCGIVIDGGVRDVDALESMGFAAFARHVTVRRTVKDDAGEVGSAVEVGGVLVRTGDAIVGDADGVVALATSEVARTLEAASAREAKERSYLERIAAGELTLDIYGWRGRVADLTRPARPRSRP